MEKNKQNQSGYQRNMVNLFLNIFWCLMFIICFINSGSLITMKEKFYCKLRDQKNYCKITALYIKLLRFTFFQSIAISWKQRNHCILIPSKKFFKNFQK